MHGNIIRTDIITTMMTTTLEYGEKEEEETDYQLRCII